MLSTDTRFGATGNNHSHYRHLRASVCGVCSQLGERLREAVAQNVFIYPDGAIMETEQAWAASLRRTGHISDHHAWKDHAQYQKSFERLVRDGRTQCQSGNK